MLRHYRPGAELSAARARSLRLGLARGALTSALRRPIDPVGRGPAGSILVPLRVAQQHAES